jgi:NhaA family Na+:H+ antiporter
MIGFALLWYAMLASGIHATISGVLAALTIPLGRGEAHSPLKQLEHRIHPWVMLGIVPLFGLASAGVRIDGLGEVLQPLPLAIMAGLFVGKQVGVFGSIWLMVRLGIVEREPSTPWIQLYGAALLTGIGFTMSLFIGALAFPNDSELVDAARLGTIAGSIMAGVSGWALLYFSRPFVVEDDRVEALEIFAGDFTEPADARRPKSEH